MEIPIETLSNIFQILGEIKGALGDIRRQNERISQLELWQARLKAACTVLAPAVLLRRKAALHSQVSKLEGRDAMKRFQPASCSSNHNVPYPARPFSIK